MAGAPRAWADSRAAPVAPGVRGEVSGIDITRPIGPEDIAAIEAGMDAYAVLVFRGQNLTDEQQLAFTLNFGGLERYKTPGHVRTREDSRLGPGIADFSNLDKHGNIMSPEDRVWFFKSAPAWISYPGSRRRPQPQPRRARSADGTLGGRRSRLETGGNR